MTNLELQTQIQEKADELLALIHKSEVFVNWVKKNAEALSEYAEHEFSHASYKIILLPTSVGTSVSARFGDSSEDMIPEVNDLL